MINTIDHNTYTHAMYYISILNTQPIYKMLVISHQAIKLDTYDVQQQIHTIA